MRNALVAGIIGLSLLGGCSGMGYAIENYSGITPVKFYNSGQKFRIFDRPNENRLMITPSIGSAMLEGATFGAGATAEISYQQAAQAYLNSTGRDCEVGDMKVVLQTQWETFYTCS
ncbi:MAG: hypothetical protein ACPH69_05845 [Planktomarina sp.]|uniref:hypothetical protein n=1 Tax=Planktomarina sp. TaxID=2024851 RepID=UPI003C3C8856